MAGLPSINIRFKEEGITAIQRGNKGVVAMILRDTSETGTFTVTSPNEIPESLSDTNKEQILLAMIGYITPPRKIIVYVIGELDEYTEAQNYLETVKFDYVVVPEIDALDTNDFASWVKAMRDTKKRRIKAVLPNTPADHEGVINFTTKDIVDLNGRTFTTAEYCSRIAGLIAGTPLTIASTFAPLPEVVDCEKATTDELDTAINNGELVLYNDGEKIKVARGVNSLVTMTQGKLESFKKIKIIDAMDLIHDDIKRTAEDNYLGKYSNSYDNKCLLIIAIKGYLQGLELDGVLESDTTEVAIDVNRQSAYLKSIGVETESMNELEIKKANTKDKVFLTASIQILDAIEEIELDISI